MQAQYHPNFEKKGLNSKMCCGCCAKESKTLNMHLSYCNQILTIPSVESVPSYVKRFQDCDLETFTNNETKTKTIAININF